MRSLLGFGACSGLYLMLVVDRVEGAVAAVELPDATIVHLPVEVLPSGVREGDRVVVRAKRLLEARGGRREGRARGARSKGTCRGGPAGGPS